MERHGEIARADHHQRLDPVELDSNEAPISMLGLMNIMLRHWRMLVLVPLATTTLVVLAVVVRPATYRAESIFMPEGQEGRERGLTGLASQLGVNVMDGSRGDPLAFYPELVRTRELLRRVVKSEYQVVIDEGRDTIRTTLVNLYAGEIEGEGDATRAAMRRLEEDISTSADPMSGLITLETIAPTPELAVQINERFLFLINEFNLERRQSQAAAERRFVEARADEVRGELHQAEGELEDFLSQNRRIQDSPQLRFEAARLQRRVDILQQVYTSLAQAFEKARIDEVRNLPVVTILDGPGDSARAIRPAMLPMILVSIVFGLMVAVGLAFWRDAFARQREEHPEDYAEFLRLRATMLGALPLRRFRARRDEFASTR